MNTLYELKKYPGRMFDIAVLHGGTPFGEAAVETSLFHERGAVCTGIQKLLQNFFILLTTPVQSMTFAPERGCDFMLSVTGAQTTQDVYSAFQFALADLRHQLSDSALPLEEQLADAELRDVSFFGDTLSMAITLTSKAGDTEQFILPIYI